MTLRLLPVLPLAILVPTLALALGAGPSTSAPAPAEPVSLGPPPQALQTALGQSLTEMLAQMVQWRARAIDDENHITELESELKAARTAKPADQAKP